MALFTKLFKRDHDPYTLPGRWYKIHLISDSTRWSVDPDKSDIDEGIIFTGSTAVSQFMNIPVEVGTPLDVCCIYGEVLFDGTNVSGASIGNINRTNDSKYYRINVPAYTVYRACDMYVYIADLR